MMNMQTMNTQAQAMKKQKGFTLIEIIAVLIVLAVLAAVAVPKYMDVVDEAKDAAAEAAVAEGFARLNNSAAILMISPLTPGAPTAAEVLTELSTTHAADFEDAGDFTIGYGEAGGIVTVTATGAAAAVLGANAVGTWIPAM